MLEPKDFGVLSAPRCLVVPSVTLVGGDKNWDVSRDGSSLRSGAGGTAVAGMGGAR